MITLVFQREVIRKAKNRIKWKFNTESALRRLMQEECKFEVNQHYIVEPRDKRQRRDLSTVETESKFMFKFSDKWNNQK